MALHLADLCLVMWIGRVLDECSMIWLERSMPGLLAVVMVTICLDYVLISVARKKYREYYEENSGTQ